MYDFNTAPSSGFFVFERNGIMGKKISIRMLTEGGMMLALAILLNQIKIYQAPNGGSISAGSMIPIMIFALRWGILPGLVVGANYGLLDFILKPYFYHPVQFILDYILAYALLGLAGIGHAKGENASTLRMVFGVILAIGGRMLSHVLSGVIFFSEYAGDQNPWVYSIIYNSTYLIPELIISLVVLLLIWKPLRKVIK